MSLVEPLGSTGTICAKMITMGLPDHIQCKLYNSLTMKMNRIGRQLEEDKNVDEFKKYFDKQLESHYMDKHYVDRYKRAYATMKALTE